VVAYLDQQLLSPSISCTDNTLYGNTCDVQLQFLLPWSGNKKYSPAHTFAQNVQSYWTFHHHAHISRGWSAAALILLNDRKGSTQTFVSYAVTFLAYTEFASVLIAVYLQIMFHFVINVQLCSWTASALIVHAHLHYAIGYQPNRKLKLPRGHLVVTFARNTSKSHTAPRSTYVRTTVHHCWILNSAHRVYVVGARNSAGRSSSLAVTHSKLCENRSYGSELENG
jgi:hypothetical protein